jgi:hypothetical protein
MRMRLLGLLIAIASASWLVSARSAQAQCCPGYALADVCSDVPMTKSRWCIQNSVPNAQQALPKAFCSYGDKVIETLERVFNIPAGKVFEYELDAATGGAHTGTACNNLGDGVAYDAFTGSAYGVSSFWGYLLSMHEAINVWTGMASSGWPTDWWADHQSAFPNLMDFHIMEQVGSETADANLTKAAAAQKKRFYPNGDSADAKVVALDNVFKAMPEGDGFAGFSRMFALQTADGVKWDNLGVKNPDVKRSEYVVAYMSLAAGKSTLGLLQGPGDNGGGKICNGTPDGTAGDAPYTCDQANIDAIASAHCALIANGKKMAELTALRTGKYTNVPSTACGGDCPSECGCDQAQHCVAAWLARSKSAGDGGVSSADAGSAAGNDAGAASRDAGRADAADDEAPRADAATTDEPDEPSDTDAEDAGEGGDDAEDEGKRHGGCACSAVGRPWQAVSSPLSWLFGTALALLLARRRQRAS